MFTGLARKKNYFKLWSKQDIREEEEYRLIKEIEKARQGFRRAHSWRIIEAEGDMGIHSQIPIMLTELRYRYLLGQARHRGMINRWLDEGER